MDALPRRITLQPPAVGAHEVTVRWTVEPPADLYRRTAFVLRFPAAVDLGAVPPALWWTIALLCLHAQWPFLRPCTVELPVRLAPGETGFWLGLLEAQVATLEAHRGSGDRARRIEIVERGPALPPLAPWADSGRVGAAFSGGKDSLAQAALLAELTPRPLLVTTTSPMPPTHDHATPRRRRVLAGIAERRDVAVVEVESDFRASWDNEAPRRMGHRVSVNEVTDCFLYFAALLAVAAASGVTRLALATQSEGNETAERDGWIVQRPQHMYTAGTQRALEALLAPAGVTYASLIAPLHDWQAQELLWTRYPDLRDLQYSCWRVGAGEAACSRCDKCLRTALPALARGDSPAPIGVDPFRLLWAMRRWRPPERPAGPSLPDAAARLRFGGQIARYLADLSLRRVARALAGTSPRQLLGRRGARALLAAWRLRRRARAWGPEPARGDRAGYLALVHPDLREPLRAVFDQHFPSEPEAGYAAELARWGTLIERIVVPLAAARAAGAPE